MKCSKLEYREKILSYPLVNNQMSDSNLGARKSRNIRDHMFIVYAAINSVINGGEESIYLFFYEKYFFGYSNI